MNESTNEALVKAIMNDKHVDASKHLQNLMKDKVAKRLKKFLSKEGK